MSCHWKMEEDQVSWSWEYIKGSSALEGGICGKMGFIVTCLFLDLFFLSQGISVI